MVTRMGRLLRTFAAASLGLGASAAHGLTLVDNGQAKAEIIVRPIASPVERFAAEELQKYLKKMSGAELPIRATAAGGVRVLVGEQPRPAGQSPLFGPDDDAESFVLRTSGDDTLSLAGNGPRGTLYAVYTLLERLGVRFFAPDFAFYKGHAEHVPAQPSIRVADLRLKVTPSFKYRRKDVGEGWSHTPATLRPLIDWMAKNRLNVLLYPYDYNGAGTVTWDQWREQLLPELEKRGILVEGGGHGYQSFLPPEKYQKEHPGWFVPGFNVFNVADDEALQTYIGNVVRYLKDHPEIRIFQAWPPDGAKWPPGVVERFGSIANAQAHLTNRLSRAVQKALPGVRVESLSYVPAIEPPDPEHMYDASVLIDFAPFGRSYRDPIFESDFARNVTYNGLIPRWKSSGFKGDIGIYEYYRKYAWHSLPVVLPELIGREIPHYRAQGATGLVIYSEPADWITYELTHLLVAALSRDTGLEADDYVAGYLRERYGAAAGPMREYFDRVEEAGRALLHRRGDGDFDDPDSVSRARESYLQAKKALTEAGQKVKEQSAPAFLIERLRWNLDYAIADTEVHYHRLQGAPEKSRAAAQRMKELVEAHRLDGILLQNTYSMRRYTLELEERENREKAKPPLYELYRRAW